MGRTMDNALADTAPDVSDEPLAALLLGSVAHLYRMETGSNSIAMTWLAPSTREILGIPDMLSPEEAGELWGARIAADN